jgi:hypothetical protein
LNRPLKENPALFYLGVLSNLISAADSVLIRSAQIKTNVLQVDAAAHDAAIRSPVPETIVKSTMYTTVSIDMANFMAKSYNTTTAKRFDLFISTIITRMFSDHPRDKINVFNSEKNEIDPSKLTKFILQMLVSTEIKEKSVFSEVSFSTIYKDMFAILSQTKIVEVPRDRSDIGESSHKIMIYLYMLKHTLFSNTYDYMDIVQSDRLRGTILVNIQQFVSSVKSYISRELEKEVNNINRIDPSYKSIHLLAKILKYTNLVLVLDSNIPNINLPSEYTKLEYIVNARIEYINQYAPIDKYAVSNVPNDLREDIEQLEISAIESLSNISSVGSSTPDLQKNRKAQILAAEIELKEEIDDNSVLQAIEDKLMTLKKFGPKIENVVLDIQNLNTVSTKRDISDATEALLALALQESSPSRKKTPEMKIQENTISQKQEIIANAKSKLSYTRRTMAIPRSRNVTVSNLSRQQ